MFLLALSWADSPVTPAQFTLGVVGLVFALLIFSRLTPDVILIGAVVLLLLSGILTSIQALAGLSNEGVITIGVLFVVGAAVRETGAIDLITARLFGRPKTPERAIARMMLPAMGLSALMNNTPLVAMLIPAVSDWGRTNRIAVSKLMIPLSYAAILGGTCTLIGTSTNLVVNGMLAKAIDSGVVAGPGLGMFDISWVGIPAAILGGLFIVGVSRWLLPDRRPAISTHDDPREYTVEMQVAPDSPLVGKTIEQAGLRHLPGVYLAEIDRDGNVMPAVSPQEVLRADDRLLFVGIVESVVDLQRIRGLLPATDQVAKLSAPRPQRCLIEAVVSNSCPLVGKTIRDGRFRNTYNAVVVAVGRNGQRLHMKIGDIVLHAGDTLLVEAHPSFADQQRNNRDFFLVSRLEGSNPPRHDRAWTSIAILVAMVVVVAVGWLSMLHAALLAAALMMLSRCVTVESARRSID
ncbi:MAG: SLC13 family permease, partial [Pirellulales bacterium]